MFLCREKELAILNKCYHKQEFECIIIYYLNGSRKPKKDVLSKIAGELGVSVEFLTDDSKSLILDSKERFVFNSTSDSTSIREAADYLEKGKQIFEKSNISQEDKQALFACLTEMYFNAAKID